MCPSIKALGMEPAKCAADIISSPPPTVSETCKTSLVLPLKPGLAGDESSGVATCQRMTTICFLPLFHDHACRPPHAAVANPRCPIFGPSFYLRLAGFTPIHSASPAQAPWNHALAEPAGIMGCAAPRHGKVAITLQSLPCRRSREIAKQQLHHSRVNQLLAMASGALPPAPRSAIRESILPT